MLLRAHEISKGFADRSLFSGLSWQIDEQARIGLVGANGSGKSTLLAILAKQLEPDSGEVFIPKNIRVGLFAQEMGIISGATALDAVLEGRSEIIGLSVFIDELHEQLAHAREAARIAELSNKLGEAQAHFEAQDGYQLVSQAKEILSSLGFSSADLQRPPTAFSGGWRMRLQLAKFLLSKPDLLLLDEPTNHLDLQSLEWLEKFLDNYPGSLLIVSHDRAFLNRSVKSIASLERRSVRLYSGNYDAFIAAKTEELEQLEKAALQQSKKIAATQAFIERFRSKATKAKQVQSRLRALEKLERIELYDDAPVVDFKLPPAKRSGHVVASLDKIHMRYGQVVVYDSLDFRVYRGDRIALVGPNGAGKSTLLKLLAGVVEFQGKRQLGEHVEAAYFAQHQVDALDYGRSVLEEMLSANVGHSNTVVRSLLGALLFSEDDVDKRVAVLSGGEKSRLALAKILLSTPNLLLMDEPTNHLDLASREALEEALAEYGGALVFISHDRFFIDRLATKVVHVENGTLFEYPGNYSEYEASRERELSLSPTHSLPSAPNQRKARRKALAEVRERRRAASHTLRRSVAQLEAEIQQLETRSSEIESALADPQTYTRTGQAQSLGSERNALSTQLEALMERWTEEQAELEAIDARFDQEERALVDDD
ncbi:MAG: ATP-binding cassette domain-containing protein [Myxococcota bacterium]|jgi:ATP-binding cassette subfamily F protein 3|nr:ATP-binding cassette domain-containing protein [Myxococcota bacterium]